MHCNRRLIVQTLAFSRSYLHRQVSPPEVLLVKGGTTWARYGRWILPEKSDFHLTFRDLLHAVNLQHESNGFTSLPKVGVLRVFFSLKNPTVSAGFEPANLGIKGRHATSRPPKPLSKCLYINFNRPRSLKFSYSAIHFSLWTSHWTLNNFNYLQCY